MQALPATDQSLASRFPGSRVWAIAAIAVTLSACQQGIEAAGRKVDAPGVPVALVGVEIDTESGSCRPRLVSRSCEISITSTSSITSGSGTSCAAMTFDATAIASGVSRMTSVPVFSSAEISLTFTTDFSTDIMYFTSMLLTWKVRTCRSWYSFCFAAVAG